MAYPIVKYNSSTGSNTAPSDAVASGTNATGTAAATSIALGGTYDVRAAADDDSDFIWCFTTSGQRHLFQITAFAPSLSAATSVTVTEAIGATFGSGEGGVAWHINGTRLSLDGDTTFTDWLGLDPGWVVELDGSFVQTAIGVSVSEERSSSSAVTDEPVTIRASASASSTPTIDVQSNGYNHLIASAFDNTHVRFEGLNLFCTTGGGSTTKLGAALGTLTLDGCNIDTSGGTSTVAISGQYGGRCLRLFNCHVKGGTAYSIFADNLTSLTMSNCWIDGQDTYGSTALVYAEGSNNVIVDTLITESTGDGLQFSIAGNTDALLWVTNVTSVGNASDGFAMTGTHTDSSSAMSLNFINCIAANNAAYGWSLPAASTDARSAGTIDFNCGYNNTSGNYDGTTAGSNDITITADPFTAAATDDYTLNSAATGGALLSSAAMVSIPVRPS
mgnify:CR=1 FL=1